MRRLLLSLALLLTIGAGCADAAFTWRTSTHGTAAGTTITVTEPTGIASGDYEFCVMDTASASSTISTPAGWTQVMVSSAGSHTKVYVFAVTGGRGGSAPTLSFTASFAGDEWACGAVGGSNVTIDASTNGTMLTSSTTQPNPPAATATTFTNDEAIAIGMNFNGLSAASYTSPTGYTNRAPAVSGSDLVFSSKDLSATGSEDPSAFAGFATTATDVWAATILLENSSPASGGGCTAPPNQLMMLGVGNCNGDGDRR